MSKVYVTGDIHGDPTRFSMDNFPEQRELTKDDYVIILGDFGLVWNGSREENYWQEWLDNKPFTTLFVCGNHENFDMLNDYPVVDFCGGKAHKIRGNIYHLMRGYVFEIADKKFFAFGGASSHDIQDGILDPYDYINNPGEFRKIYNNWKKLGKIFRVKGFSWWPQEMPNEDEMNRGIANLESANWKVDYVITHCFPQSVASAMGFFEPDKLTNYFDIINEKLLFEKWFAGHYHREQQIFTKYIEMYYEIKRVI